MTFITPLYMYLDNKSMNISIRFMTANATIQLEKGLFQVT